MKKYRLILMSALLTLVCSTFADNLTVSDIELKPGKEFDLEIGLSNPDNMYSAFQFDLILPKGVSILNEDGEFWVTLNRVSISKRTQMPINHVLSVSKVNEDNVEQNTYRFLDYSNPLEEIEGTSGTFLTITLIADADITSGKKQATIKNLILTQSNGTDLKPADLTFNITIPGSGKTYTLDGNSIIPAEDLTEGSVIATSLTYSREMKAPGESSSITIDGAKASLYTICLPEAPTKNENVRYYTLEAVNSSTLIFKEVSDLTSNTPYLLAVTGTANFTYNKTLENITLKKEADNSSKKDGYFFKGTLTGLTNAEAAAAGAYILQSNNKWNKVTTNNTNAIIPAFRAYIVAEASDAPLFLTGNIGDSNMTGIQNIRTINQDGTENWYDLNGVRIQNPSKGINILNGHKVVIK